MNASIYSMMVPIFFALFINCSTPVQSPDNVCYQSNHFNVYYYESEYTAGQVATITAKKERLLTYINSSLGVSFDHTIDSYLFIKPDNRAWAVYRGITFEPKNYILTDPGHEIVHIVVFSELGISSNDFLTEGFAEAFQLNFIHPAERFVTYCTSVQRNPRDTPSISDALTRNKFSYELFDYYRAGAFIAYLVEGYGVSAVKSFYIASITDSESVLSDTFATLFNETIRDAEDSFYDRYFFQSSDSTNEGTYR